MHDYSYYTTSRTTWQNINHCRSGTITLLTHVLNSEIRLDAREMIVYSNKGSVGIIKFTPKLAGDKSKHDESKCCYFHNTLCRLCTLRKISLTSRKRALRDATFKM